MKIPHGLDKSNASLRSDVSVKSDKQLAGQTMPLGKVLVGSEFKDSRELIKSPLKTVFLDQKDTSTLSKPPLSQFDPASLTEKSSEYSERKTISIMEIFKETTTNVGIPKDLLSFSLIAFSRFFSLPINPQLIKTLRREILESGKNSSPESSAGKAALEAEVLARLSTGDKGVVLSPEALERYSGLFGSPEGEKRNPQEQEDDPSAEILQAIADEQSKEDDLLDFLNSLPGKNGQYWLVFPLIINVRGVELKVFIRLLKREPIVSIGKGEKGSKGEQLIVDISSPSKQWRCFLREIDGKFRADIRVCPEQNEKALKILQKEAVRFLDSGSKKFGNFTGFDEVLVRNSDSAFSWIEDFCDESLPYFDKEV